MMTKWEVRRLGEICKIYQPKTISKKEMKVDGEYPVFGANGIIGKYDQYNHEEPELLVTCRGATCGSVNVSLPKSWITGNAMVVKPIISSLDRTFLEYFFRGAVDFSKVISGAAQPQITRQSLAPVEIAFPPLPEQKRIVAILDEVFAGIDAAVANTEKNLDNARELFESYLNAVFTQKGDGWVEKTIGEISAVKGGKRVPKGYKLQSEPTKHPYITVKDFNEEGSVDFEGIRYVSEEVHAEIRRYTISPKDLYISIAGTIGKTGIIPDELDGANLTENACKLVLNDEVVNRFVFFFTKTASFTDQALQNTRVAAQPKLALSRLATIRLSIPNVTEQHRIIASCDAFWAETQRLEDIYQQKLNALAELKQSILQKAFAGELTSLPEKKLEEAVA